MSDNEWLSAELAPYGEDILLWLKAPPGEEHPIGQIIGRFEVTDHWEGFCLKATPGIINTGLQQDLITHFKLLDPGPHDEAS